MLKRLHFQNFTVFADAKFEFGPGLNIVVGTNGTGKSHVLKFGYILELSRYEAMRQVSEPNVFTSKLDSWFSLIYKNTLDIFQVAENKALLRLNKEGRISWANVKMKFYSDYSGLEDEHKKYIAIAEAMDDMHFSIREKESYLEMGTNQNFGQVFAPVFIPAKELLTLSWMLPASDQLILPIERNYLDLLKQLRGLPKRNPEGVSAIEKLKNVLGGEVEEQSGKYYLIQQNGHSIEVNMVAEGLRKFGTLQKLLSNGSLTPKTPLFWDEPEANLNPALLQKLAAILAELARQGFQIILATHSTDLLKEFHILSRQKDAEPLPIKYFGLNAKPGEATTVTTTDNFEHLPDVVALEVELKQADELEEIFIREDREYYANHPGEQPSL